MSSADNVPATEQTVLRRVEADPKRPFKAYVPAILAVLYAVIQGVRDLYADAVWDTDDTLAVLLLLVGAVGVYFVKNPKVLDPNKRV